MAWQGAQAIFCLRLGGVDGSIASSLRAILWRGAAEPAAELDALPLRSSIIGSSGGSWSLLFKLRAASPRRSSSDDSGGSALMPGNGAALQRNTGDTF